MSQIRELQWTTANYPDVALPNYVEETETPFVSQKVSDSKQTFVELKLMFTLQFLCVFCENCFWLLKCGLIFFFTLKFNSSSHIGFDTIPFMVLCLSLSSLKLYNYN